MIFSAFDTDPSQFDPISAIIVVFNSLNQI